MKRLRYIFAILFSLLIIYAGVGVSIVHYCCTVCETTHACCTNGCGKCHKSHHSSDESCQDEGCKATIYKVDLMKQTYRTSAPTIMLQLFCAKIPDFHDVLATSGEQEILYDLSPHPVSSRHYLALYSILLI